MSISEWSTTPADNASGATGINWAEGQAPSTVNDSARQMMADVATWYAQLVGAGMLFAQAAAPTGWTKDATTYDHALRLTNGTGAATAGTVNCSTVFSYETTGTHALTQAEMPSHTHTISVSNPSHTHTATDGGHTHDTNVAWFSSGGTTKGYVGGGNNVDNNGTYAWGSNVGHASITVGATTTAITASAASAGSGVAHSHDINLRIKYYDLIRCTKDA